jgi:hypothetical protein
MALVAQIAPDAGPFLIKWRAKLQQNGIAHEEMLARTDDKVDLAPRGSVHFPAVDWSDWLETRRGRPRPTAKDEATFAFVDFDRRGCLSL